MIFQTITWRGKSVEGTVLNPLVGSIKLAPVWANGFPGMVKDASGDSVFVENVSLTLQGGVLLQDGGPVSIPAQVGTTILTWEATFNLRTADGDPVKLHKLSFKSNPLGTIALEDLVPSDLVTPGMPSYVTGAEVPLATSSSAGGVVMAGNLAGSANAPDVIIRPLGGGAPIRLDRFASDVQGEIAARDGDLDSKADLGPDGKIPASQLPDLAVTEFLGEVAGEAEMLDLSGQQGDWCVRTDTDTPWMLVSADASVVSGWRQMVSPASGVQSVAGRTGAVSLSKHDVGLSAVNNTSDADKPVSLAMAAALAEKSDASHSHSAASVGAVAAYGGVLGMWLGQRANLPTQGTPGVLYVTFEDGA